MTVHFKFWHWNEEIKSNNMDSKEREALVQRDLKYNQKSQELWIQTNTIKCKKQFL